MFIKNTIRKEFVMRLPCMNLWIQLSTPPSEVHRKYTKNWNCRKNSNKDSKMLLFWKSSSLFCNMNTADALFLFPARCDVQGQNIRVFDQLQYVANIKRGCPYVLVQEHNTGRPSRIMVWHTISIDLTKADFARLRGVQDILEYVALMISMHFSINKIHQSKPN